MVCEETHKCPLRLEIVSYVSIVQLANSGFLNALLGNKLGALLFTQGLRTVQSAENSGRECCYLGLPAK